MSADRMTSGQLRMTRQLAAVAAGRRRDVPEAGRMVWGWFRDLHAVRSIGPDGPCPITYAEIAAYAQLHGLPLEGRHVDLIRAIDVACLDRTSGPQDIPATAGITAGAFDAVFG